MDRAGILLIMNKIRLFFLLNHYLRSLALNSNYYDTCRSSDRYVVRSGYLVSDCATQDVSYRNYLTSSTLYSHSALATDYLNTLSSDCLVSRSLLSRVSGRPQWR